MTDDDYLTPAVRRNNTIAIALLTASHVELEGGSLLPDTMLGYLRDGHDESELVFGLFNIARILLVRLEKLAGRDPHQELRYLAEKYGEQ